VQEKTIQRQHEKENLKKLQLEDLKKLWNKILAWRSNMIKNTEVLQIIETKNDAIKIEDKNLCEKCVYTGQKCLLYNSR